MTRQKRVLERRSINTVWWNGYRAVKSIYVYPDSTSTKKKAHACFQHRGSGCRGERRDGSNVRGSSEIDRQAYGQTDVSRIFIPQKRKSERSCKLCMSKKDLLAMSGHCQKTFVSVELVCSLQGIKLPHAML